MTKKQKNNIVIYQAKTGAIELESDIKKDTVWASLDQVAQVFERDKSVISRHIKNIFKDNELKRNSVVAFFATTATDGKTYQVEHFNLDVILSVGYRVNSQKAILFRQWATKTLRGYIIDGYAINRKRIADNHDSFLKAVEDVKRLLPAGNLVKTEDALELIKMFANTWVSLEAYDKDIMPKSGASKKRVKLTADELKKALSQLRDELIGKKEATELFGTEKQKDSIESIVGNVMQSFGGKELYPSAEEKCAHLLYFVVKNHPFIDGNKRSGAFAFVWFLKKTGLLDTSRLTSEALTALTLLVAESNPKDKDQIVGLVLMLLKK